MSPRIIHLPLSGRDRRHHVRELRLAEQAHRELPNRVEEAYRAAHRLACEEWSVRQFIGGPAEPSPRIADAIAGGCELLEVRCRRCSHESLIDLAEVVWPREKARGYARQGAAMPSLQGRAEKAATGPGGVAATTSRGRSASGETACSTLIR